MCFLKESQQHHPTIDDMLLELKRMIKAQNQALVETFEQQTMIEEAPGSLAERSPPHQRPKEPPDQQPVMTPQQGWSLPPSVTNPPLDIKPWAVPRLRREPPRFDGENAQDWIHKIQKYYNHHYTPLDDRLYLTQYLFDHPASDWREYWVETNKGKGWDDFLLDVKQRFDPDLYESYAATTSIGPFGSTGGTSQHQLQPKRRTKDPLENQELNSQPVHQIEEVKHAPIVVNEHNADGGLMYQTCSEALHMASKIIAGDNLEVIGYDNKQVVQHTNSTRIIIKSLHDDIVASTIPSPINVPSNGVVPNDGVALGFPSNVVIHEESLQVFALPDRDMASSSPTETQPKSPPEFSDVMEATVGENDHLLVEVQQLGEVPLPIESFPIINLLKGDRELYRSELPIADGRSIPPRDDPLHLGRNPTVDWRLPPDRTTCSSSFELPLRVYMVALRFPNYYFTGLPGDEQWEGRLSAVMDVDTGRCEGSIDEGPCDSKMNALGMPTQEHEFCVGGSTFGGNIHSDAIRIELCSDRFVGSSLNCCYSKSDRGSNIHEQRETQLKFWKNSDPKHAILTTLIDACRECCKDFSLRVLSSHICRHSIWTTKEGHLCTKQGSGFEAMRAVFNHTNSQSQRVMTVASIVESNESLSIWEKFFPIRKKRFMITYKGTVSPSLSSADASHFGVFELDETGRVARFSVILASDVVSSLKFNSSVEDSVNSVCLGGVVASCGSIIFCGNDGDLVPHALIVEHKASEFGGLDVHFDDVERLIVENGMKDLMCGNDGSGDPIALPRFLDGETYETVGKASTKLGGDLAERACCHSIELMYAMIPVVVGLVRISVMICIAWRWMVTEKGDNRVVKAEQIFSLNSAEMVLNHMHQLSLFGFETAANAMYQFHDNNFLGKEIVLMKRLTAAFGQGVQKYKNDEQHLVISILQHIILIKLRGYYMEKEWKILIYDYMLNKSLDICILDNNPSQKDWKTHFHIMEGNEMDHCYSNSHFHLEDKVILVRGGVDWALALQISAKDHLQYIFLYFI